MALLTLPLHLSCSEILNLMHYNLQLALVYKQNSVDGTIDFFEILHKTLFSTILIYLIISQTQYKLTNISIQI